MRSVSEAIEEPTPRGIAAGIARLIRTGELAPGDRLPTVRELARELGVSPATVSTAWQTLASTGLIVSRGRSGSTVRATSQNWMPLRYQGLEGTMDAAVDLSQGTPDVRLLPSVDAALRAALEHNAMLSIGAAGYRRRPDIPELHDLLREQWPAPVESLTVVDGAEIGLHEARELAGLGPCTAHAAIGARDFGEALLGLAALLRLIRLFEVVGAEALVAARALDQRVGERGNVAGGLPHLGGQDD
mgnify:CR=1 FL=1